MSNYKLINPYIKGNFSTIFNGNNSVEVADKTWKKISKYFLI